METILAPLRAAASRPARRAYLTTFLLVSGSIFLLFLSAFIYILFYINYVPQIGIQAPLYLQYTPSHSPTAHLTLPPSSIIPHQPYTVTVHLRLPTSPTNIQTGNFMLHLSLQSAYNITLASSRRPAILTYRSPLLDRIDTIFRAPLLITGWHRQEEKLSIPLLENIILDEEVRGATLSIGPGIGVYDVSVEFRARFQGVRWLMYNYRITTFFLATVVFWGIEVVFMTVVWWIVYSHFSSSAAGSGLARKGTPEGEDDEDYLRRRRTGYPTPSPTPGPEMEGLVDAGASEEVYADDEDEPSFSSSEEELVGVDVRDSGLGSMSESVGSSSRARAAGEEGQRRRRRRSSS